MSGPDMFRRPVAAIKIEGYKSIRDLGPLELRGLNILIGANGTGKSNFIGVFKLLSALARENLRKTVARGGGAERMLFLGRQQTEAIRCLVKIGDHGYEVGLRPAEDDSLLVYNEGGFYKTNANFEKIADRGLTLPMTPALLESRIKESYETAEARNFAKEHDANLRILYSSLRSWVVYHFHDTSDGAPVKTRSDIVDGEVLREEGDNLAAFLYAMQHRSPAHYKKIVDTVRLVAPFFDRFHLDPLADNQNQTQLRWYQRGSDRIFHAGQMSDGTLRFICLATVLLQPDPPATILLDEPELGLHPYALQLLGGMLVSTSHRTQLIVSTQSAALLNDVEPEDVIVVERGEDEASTFRRLKREDLTVWLEEYTLGELWQKNVLGGRPR